MNKIRASAGTLKEHFLNYLLAIISMTILTGIFFVIVVLGIGVILWIINPGAGYVGGLADLLLSWTIPMSTGDLTVIMTNAFFVVIAPLYAVFAWMFAGIYAMTHQFLNPIEAGVTNPISLWRKNWKGFFVNGILMSAVSMIPAVIICQPFTILYGGSIPHPIDWALGFLGIVWFFVIFGFIQMALPAISSGKSAIGALKESFVIGTKKFRSVFGNWLGYFLLLFMWFIPIIFWGFHFPGATPATDPIFAVWTSLAAVGAFFDLFAIVPMMIIGMTDVYLENASD